MFQSMLTQISIKASYEAYQIKLMFRFQLFIIRRVVGFDARVNTMETRSLGGLSGLELCSGQQREEVMTE